ncbi:topoisomerase 1-associated factor 1 [Ceratobasidium sp. AG-Ba]|nr:topoisomerase 1-associated factor 1 [Ceratobasidium sp. AG-Ba]
MSSDGETVDISSGSDAENEARDDQQQTTELTRREIFGPVIQNVVTALGGVETDPNTNETRYVPGDDCLGCLKDLKKLWRKDDTDDERTVARMFWETRVLINDLVPILVETAGRKGTGWAGDKRAVACADVIAAMTWPIDIAEELKELDEKLDERTDYATLVLAQLHYKEVLSRPESLEAMRNILMACMAKEVRALRDTQIILLVLHILRNLLVLKDPPRTSSSLSSSSTSLASLQSRLLVSLRKTGLLDFILMCASNVDNHAYSEFSAVLLEISYLLVRGVAVRDVVRTRAKKDKDLQRGGMVEDGEDEELKALLEREKREKQMTRKGAPTRHSRFGTTIALKTIKFVFYRKQLCPSSPRSYFRRPLPNDRHDQTKTSQKTVKVDEVGVFNPLSSDALSALSGYAGQFIESCFNTFMGSVLKDIRAERPRFTEKDNLRLLFLTKWFLEFFLSVREEQEKARKQQALFASDKVNAEVWPLDMLVRLEPAWGPWVLRRMRAAVEEKPKQWVELHAGIDCLVQIFERLQVRACIFGFGCPPCIRSTSNVGEMGAFPRRDVFRKRKKPRLKKGVTEEEGIVDVESEGEQDKTAADDLIQTDAFYPKNRGQWKAYSSYEPEVKPKSGRPAGKAELTVKRGYKASEQIGIAVACLSEQEGGKLLIDWVLDVNFEARWEEETRWVEETDGDGGEDAPEDEDEEAAAVQTRRKPRECRRRRPWINSKIIHPGIPYRGPPCSAATSDKHLKLLMRLVGFTCEDDDAFELEWHVPASLTPFELQTSQNVIEQYLANPIDLQGKKATSLLATKRGTRRQRQAEPSSSEGSPGLSARAKTTFCRMILNRSSVELHERPSALKDGRLNSGERGRAEAKKRERKERNGRVQVCGDHRGFGPRRRRCILCTGEGAYGARQKAGREQARDIDDDVPRDQETDEEEKGKRTRDEAEGEEAGAEADAETGEGDEGTAGLSDDLASRLNPKQGRNHDRGLGPNPAVESDAEDNIESEPAPEPEPEEEPAEPPQSKPRARPRMRVAAEESDDE